MVAPNQLYLNSLIPDINQGQKMAWIDPLNPPLEITSNEGVRGYYDASKAEVKEILVLMALLVSVLVTLSLLYI